MRGRLDRLGHLLGKLQLGFDGVGTLHGHDDGGIGEPIVDGEPDPVFLDVGDDYPGIGDRLAEGGTEETDGSGAKHQDGRAGCQTCPVGRVEGNGEGLDEGAELQRDF